MGLSFRHHAARASLFVPVLLVVACVSTPRSDPPSAVAAGQDPVAVSSPVPASVATVQAGTPGIQDEPAKSGLANPPAIINPVSATEPESVPAATAPDIPAATVPEPEPEPEVEPEPEAAPEPPVAEEPLPPPFDPSTITTDHKQVTLAAVQDMIANLNAIIRSKDFGTWEQLLTKEYREYYSSAETLARLSEAPVLKRQKIILSDLDDYFEYVVYPSRQNGRVDDIEFIDDNRILAITVTPRGERLVLYNLEKIGDIWMIAKWR